MTWDRESTPCANLEKVECIGNWLREELIVTRSSGGKGLVVDGEITAEDVDLSDIDIE